MNSLDEDEALVFTVEDKRFALPSSVVARVIRAVFVNPLPGAPAMVMGIINVHGEIVPVMNLRRRLGLPEREIEPDDQFILARESGRLVALVCDHIEGLVPLSRSMITPIQNLSPASEIIEGVIRIGSNLVLLQDLEAFLRPEENESLATALSRRESEPSTQSTGTAE